MNQQIIFTVIAQDKPGIVTTIADMISQHGGNWLDSRMSQLAGEFAGIVHIEIPLEKKKDLEYALDALSTQGIIVTTRQSNKSLTESHYKLYEIEIFGNDRPGIVAEVSKLFSEKFINIIEFDTSINDASMSGGQLFHSNAVISVEKGTNVDELQDKLHDLANALALDIEWTAQL
ncbi:MAG: glycine cleavage system protein R [Ostreibacterium sp.]